MLSNKISLVKKFIKLSKLRVVELLLVTTVPSMIVSLYSFPPLSLVNFYPTWWNVASGKRKCNESSF